MIRRTHWLLLLAASVVCCCVLSLYPGHAAPAASAQAAANPAEQRIEMLAELKEIKELLKEQNALFRSGNLKVIVVAEKQGPDAK